MDIGFEEKSCFPWESNLQFDSSSESGIGYMRTNAPKYIGL